MSGLIAAFATEAAIEEALDSLRVDPPGKIETYTPKALVEDEKGTSSPLPLIIFIAGILGAAAAYALEAYSDVVNWPVNVGGRPPFSWPAFVPVAFEMGILWAISAGFFGYLIAGRLLHLWQPVDECAAMREATRDQWVIAVYTSDHAKLAQARRILESFRPLSIEYISPELEEVPA